MVCCVLATMGKLWPYLHMGCAMSLQQRSDQVPPITPIGPLTTSVLTADLTNDPYHWLPWTQVSPHCQLSSVVQIRHELY